MEFHPEKGRNVSFSFFLFRVIPAGYPKGRENSGRLFSVGFNYRYSGSYDEWNGCGGRGGGMVGRGLLGEAEREGYEAAIVCLTEWVVE